jgi:hypothetical protein
VQVLESWAIKELSIGKGRGIRFTGGAAPGSVDTGVETNVAVKSRKCSAHQGVMRELHEAHGGEPMRSVRCQVNKDNKGGTKQGYRRPARLDLDLGSRVGLESG